METSKPNIVLVHGAWADGSCWSAAIEGLQAKGYNVTAPQFPESSLADDVARLRQVLNRQGGPTVVVGHSYGGQIMTTLSTDAPNVVGLVYIAAFGLDEGETIGGLLAQGIQLRRSRTSILMTRALPCLDSRGRLRGAFRRGCRSGESEGHVRRPAGSVRVDTGRRHWSPGLEVTAVVVREDVIRLTETAAETWVARGDLAKL
ncbi:MAG TPA: alpha/beta hydrolase [Acidimicrobiales bacterium]|nr:alpha/beta hydrolase [Acidimicrobiales bacterium]